MLNCESNSICKDPRNVLGSSRPIEPFETSTACSFRRNVYRLKIHAPQVKNWPQQLQLFDIFIVSCMCWVIVPAWRGYS